MEALIDVSASLQVRIVPHDGELKTAWKIMELGFPRGEAVFGNVLGRLVFGECNNYSEHPEGTFYFDIPLVKKHGR